MRRHLFLGLGGALLLTLCGAGAASADSGPHVSTAVGAGFSRLVGAGGCIGCHRANTTEAAFPPKTGQSGLCLTCHGPSAGGSTTDVDDGVGYGAGGMQVRDGTTAPGALRAGGFEYALIGSAAATRETFLSDSAVKVRNQVIPVLEAPQASTSQHGRPSGTGTASAGGPIAAGAAVTLECGSCHDPHGNGSYRILRSSPAGSGSPTAAVGVRIPDATVKVYTTTNYWLSGDASVPSVVKAVGAGTAAFTTDGFTAGIARWCTTCHQRAHLDTTIKMVGTTCANCHVAHGSNAKRVRASSNPVAQADELANPWRSSLLRIDSNQTICLMCHNS